jgi:DNA-binding NtrC family response regulator
LQENLVASELFGHERGAFTGADRAREGAFERAHGGTLFLDEIGELGLSSQPALLRALESRKVQRVGGTQPISVDVRIIAATNRNLRGEVNQSRFRPDLYYRLAVLEVTLPPLRERLEDLPLLVDDLVRRMEGLSAAEAAQLRERSLLEEIEHHLWPGNVRELRNFLERQVATGRSSEAAAVTESPKGPEPYRAARLRFERRYFEALLREHRGSVTAAARAAGLSRVSLYQHLTRCGLR